MCGKTFYKLLAAGLFVPLMGMAQTLKVQYKFSTVNDENGTYAGSLKNGATLTTEGTLPVLSLGNNNGYFDFGTAFGSVISSLSGDFTISTYVFIDEATNLSTAGNFIYNFAKSSATGYIFFGANQTKYVITPTTWNSESAVSMEAQFVKGEWKHVAYTQTGTTGRLYIDGTLVKTGTVSMKPSALGSTSQNYLGRSCYSGDAYLKGAKYSDFRIYDGAVSASTVNTLANDLDVLNAAVYAQQLDDALAAISLGDTENLNHNLTLPTSGSNSVAIAWTTSDGNVISDKGVISRPAAGQPASTATLTATVSKKGISRTQTFNVSVAPYLSDEDAVAYDLGNIVLTGNLNNLRSDLVLPSNTTEGAIITWKSDDTDYLTDAGTLKQLSESGKKTVTLTATAQKGTQTATRTFTIQVAEKEPYTNYLFAYFPSNDNENLYYAISADGYNYKVLNNGQRVMLSDSIALKKAIRDPHILRAPDGKFYMVMTDMKSAEGWSSNRGIVMMKSDDLVHWTHSTVNFPTRFPAWSSVTRVWAPQTIWDANYNNGDGTKGRLMVYFSLRTGDSAPCAYDKDYYCYANDDFTDLMTAPVFLYDRGSATIDADIVYNEADSLYHMFYKNEGEGGICKVTAKTLTAPAGNPAGSQWGTPSGTLQQTTVAVEGAGVFRKINEDTWVLMYDCYGSGYYQFCSSTDLEHFTLRAQTTTSGAFTPRHGTVIPITAEETAALLAAFPTSGLEAKPTGASNVNINQTNLELNTTAKTIYLPVRYGTDLSHFDPQLTATTGTAIMPAGAQDFTGGAVTYTFSNTGGTSTYTVTAEVCANPIIPDFHADPEILFSHKTGKFYIYPTTDGLSGWAGHTFDVYSSSDLVLWENEGTILDLATDDVPWATGNAWAPCIEEKWIDGEYKYFFYFSGNNPTYNKKTLGYAVSNSPTGPFTAATTAFVTSSPASGQIIDSDVFTDPASGNTYYYWGNGSMVVSQMGADMTSYSGAKAITPAGGTLSNYAYREGTYVFYRNGIYYFMWSVDDTGSANYHVAYGTSTSPTGPITVAANPIVLIQDPANGIYGTGHNSVLQIPGRDEWYIVYHRINKAYLNNGPGYHREVCIDKLEFNADGTIKQVTPTHKGIEPVDMSDYIDDYMTGIQTPAADENSSVVRTTYFSINGANLGAKCPAAKGVYLKEDVLDNGTRRITKLMK